jgi:hypothetical protein
MDIPEELLALAARWDELKRWERRKLGQALRILGLSYGEIGKIIPVGKGTLSPWCRDIPLTPEQIERLRANSGTGEVGRAKAGAKLRQRNLERIAVIRSAAYEEAERFIKDAAWVAGTMAYWSEGDKDKHLGLSNSDPALVRVFINWARTYFDLTIDRFTPRVHFHTGQTENELRLFWSQETGIPLAQFIKGFMKQEGTGHRKNTLYHGTLQTRVQRSGDLLHRVFGWIDYLASDFGVLR